MTMILTERNAGSSMYVLLSKDHRVSRSFRATWYLRMLLTGQPWDTSGSDDLSVLSVDGEEGISPSTDVFYICQQYSLVFVLDMTPTMIQVSNSTCEVKLNEGISALSASFHLLTKPFLIPGGEEELRPDLCVTVLTYCGGNHTRKPVQVMLQGFYLKSSNCDEITASITKGITALENSLSRAPSEREEYSQDQTNDASMEGLIKAGTLALQLLPRNALKGIIIFTDGVLGFTSPSNMHNAVNQMRGANTSCWVVQVGGRPDPSAAFGLMPDSETLHFMSLACNGCVMQPEKIIAASKKDLPDGSLNVLHRAVLLWSFQQTAHASRVRGVVSERWGVVRREEDEEEEIFSPTIHKPFDKNTIHAPFLCLIGCRIRDGFFLKSVKDQDSILEVTMCYPWQASVNIYYTIQAAWPLSESSAALNTATAYDGPYSFVHDIHCNLNEPITSHFRATAVRKFKQVLKSQSYSDTFLAHFLSFSATPTYHTLPQKIQDGMPLFHLPPNQAKPVPAVSLSSSGDKKKKESALVNFWSPLCTIDTSLWYRWFHTDKIILILDQDTYLPRNLLAPSANHRFASIQCRIAASKLFNYLKTWCSFVLLENQSFIRFLPTTESPKYFSLVRVAQKHPCVVLHVGHIEGTPHSLQSKTLRELQEAIQALSVERAQSSKRGRGPSSQKGKAAKLCAFLVGKQLQRVMIRYDNLTMAGTPFQGTLSLVQSGTETERMVQNDYLTGTSWQWLVPHPLPTLLTALLRHRLKEGFHITRAQSGIVTLTAQLSVTQPHSTSSLPMLLQYIIFSLNANPSTSLSSSVAVGGGSGYPTCELWVEPQYGTVTQAPAGLQYILGCTHTEIARKLHAEDQELMSTVSSFVYLHHMCERGCHSLPRAPLEADMDNREGCIASSLPQTVAVPFKVTQLFPKCRVIGFTLNAFPEATTAFHMTSLQASPLNALFWKQLFKKLRELAPTEVPLTTPPEPHPLALSSSSSSPSPLLQRLLSSKQLSDMCRRCDIHEDTADMGWRCLAMSPADEENTLSLLLLPNVFCRDSSDKRDSREIGKSRGEEGGSERESVSSSSAVFFLPFLLLLCDQDVLLDPDPATPHPPSLLPDIFQHLPLSRPSPPASTQAPTPSPQTSLDGADKPPEPLTKFYSSLANVALCTLVSKLRALHFSCYLHALHTMLADKKCSVPPEGFRAAVDICTRSTLSVDCTPLIGALCRHSLIEPQSSDTLQDETPENNKDGSLFGSQMLSQLIRTVSSSSSNSTRDSCCRLHYVEELEEPLLPGSQPPHCVQWDGEPQEMFDKYLSVAGFEAVPHCKGYYWLRGEEGEEDPIGGVEDGEEGNRAKGQVGDETGPFLSPHSEASTVKRKHSLTIDTTQTGGQSDDSTSTGDDSDMAALSPLFSPSKPHFLESSREEPSLPPAPLFLQLACSVRGWGGARGEEEGEEEGGAIILSQPPYIPTCLKAIIFCNSSSSSQPTTASYSVSLSLSFLSFSPSSITHPSTTMDNSVEGMLSSLPTEYQTKASSIKQKAEWLITDELISLSREATPITLPLLQAMATHVHTSPRVSSCFEQRLPIKFVFGPQKSMIHLETEVEAIQIGGYDLVNCGEYYYLKHVPQPSVPNTPDIVDPHLHTAPVNVFDSLAVPGQLRSKTPDSRPRLPERGCGHRRTTSACIFTTSIPSAPLVPQGNVRSKRRGSTPPIQYPPLPPMAQRAPSNCSLGQGDSSYDASRSSSCSELSARPPPGPLDTPPFWLALRLLQDEIHIYFQIRHSAPDLEGCLAKLRPLITQLSDKAKEACHRANQLLLLRDMLETRQCSPLLLPESFSEEWVENVIHKRMPSLLEGGSCGIEPFSPQEFRCALQWDEHITPHYRLKSMKMNIRKALLITRVALEPFAVTNRKDVYVLQDVQENAAESIFYLKIDESLCRVDDSMEAEESTLIPYDRCDTRATEETLSTTSYHPSILSEHVDMVERQSILSESLFNQPGRPRESLVLQLYGINKPSQSLLERLTHRITFKLDDAALEIMCGLYTRNQKLKLTPSDVQFLQPPGSDPSHQLRILVPSWVRESHALFFYYLQSLSTLALKPKYTSQEPHIQFQVPQRLQNVCLSAGLPADVHQDYLFLYIRPHTQGRGMAVFSVSLTDAGGRLVPPRASVVAPREGGWNPANLELTHSVCSQGTEAVLEDDREIPPQTDGYIMKVDIWEKGNVGITDLSHKLHLCLKQALCDYILELYFLPQPIARIDDMVELEDSPLVNSPFVVLEPSPPGFARQESNDSILDSPRRTLFEKGEIRVPSSLGFSSQRSLDSPLSPDTPAVSEPLRSRCDTINVTRTMDDVLHSLDTAERNDTSDKDQAAEQSSGLTWQEREINRREMEALNAVQREAHHGRRGVLENTYSDLIPRHLVEMCKLTTRSVSHYTFPILGTYSAEVFLNETVNICSVLCPDFSLSTFRLGSSGVYSHYTLQKTSRQRTVAEVSETKFIVVGRNLKQWDEARSPDVMEIRLTQPWIDAQTKHSLQLFHPLDSKKISKMAEYPLMSLAKNQPCFVPRQRLLVLSISQEMAELWLYNLSEEVVVRVRNRLDGLHKWQQMRVGFLHHLLAQKTGLFQHTHARDLHEWTSMAAKHCSSLQDTSLLYRNPAPVSALSSQRQVRPQPMPALESLYLEVVPTGRTPQTMDPVYNHGHQVKESHTHFRKAYESRDLLGKVFTSWPSHTGSAAVPVDSSLIHQLKRLARLLHFCSSRLLLRPPASPGTSAEQTAWFDSIRNEVLSLYIQYLKTQDFEEITERASMAPPPRHKGSSAHTPTRSSQTPLPPAPVPPQKFYKCMQRSWTHGIILIEMTFREERFDVKIFTLESSRLNGQKSLSPEVYGLFSTECARYKDLIHVHSFMHDFHLSLVLGMLTGEREIPDWLDMKAFLEQFTRENKIPASFIRNRLERGCITVPMPSVKPAQLYHHLLAHSDVFGMQTLELRSAGKRENPSASTTTGDICLHIDVCPRSLGPTTSPQLSKLLEDAQESYAIHVIAVCDEHKPHCLNLIFYLLLVNINNKFPRLTCDSSLYTVNSSFSASKYGATRLGQSPDESLHNPESELHLSMRKRRIKLGLDPQLRSTASQLVLDGNLLCEHVQSLQGHFEGIVKNALHHMRRDELWKRMLYGRYRSEGTKPTVTQISFEQLNCDEFRELLRLVTYCPLEKLDPRLTALRKQTKKWFRRLMAAMEVHFSENVRVYKTENENYYFTVLINPDWSDMVILAQSDRDGKSQGLYSVYRKPQEGGTVPQEQRPITAHIEADRQHIENIVNFCCCFLWSSMLDSSTPPQPHISLL